MALDSISNITNATDQQLLLQTRASDGIPTGDALTASPGFAAVQYVEPPPPPPPRPGPPPGRVPDIFSAPNPAVGGTSPDDPASTLAQRLTDVQSFLLALPPVTDTITTALTPNIPPTGAVQGKTLLTL
jgi:hypothetical protein